MSPIQQMLLGVGSVAEKTYIDDVFSTYLFDGNNGSAPFSQSISNGIDLSGEGGLVWLKCRSDSQTHVLTDTVRGANKWLRTNGSNAESTSTNSDVTAFSSTGFTVGGDSRSNAGDMSSWTFRKSPAFTIKQYSGTGSAQTLSHDLGSVPGVIICKCTSTTGHWRVYHRSLGEDGALVLNSTNAAMDDGDIFGTTPTSTNFYVGNDSNLNTNGETYIAYLFAGGESTAATARSVDFDQSGDYLNTTSSSSDFTMGTGDFTVECWVYIDDVSTINGFWQISNTSGGLATDFGDTLAVAWDHQAGEGWQIYGAGSYSKTGLDVSPPSSKQWVHTAYVRSSGTSTLYINGVAVITQTDTHDYDGTYIAVGGYYSTGYLMGGKISNLRVVKGTAVYTSAFKPPTAPLTNITNTKLLCCNNSSTTGSTVTPVTLNSNGDPTASTDSPFDDPAGFVFGESEDQNVIKCGSYVGNGSSDGPEINLGWEPSWLLIKSATESGENWAIFDSMRGIVTGGDDKYLYANSSGTENTYNVIELTPTGFKCDRDDGTTNRDGETFIFCAIRRSDGYVGKPPELGTDVFAMDTGSDSSTIPTYDSGFPVDFSISRTPASSGNWFTGARLMSGKTLYTNTAEAESTRDFSCYDSNVGFDKDTWGPGSSTYQAWMWKRHAGMDVVTYEAGGVVSQRSHQLGRTPEMIFIKCRNTTKDWIVYHKGLNGGTNPQNKAIKLNTNAAEVDSDASDNYWDGTPPTATHFTTGEQTHVGGDGNDYLALLFSSVTGISKVGYYTGNGTSSSSTQTITTGFQPRFLIIRRTDAANWWIVLDTTRGWASGDDKYLQLNDSAAQADYEFGVPISTGFTLTGNNGAHNVNSGKYIYYCHA